MLPAGLSLPIALVLDIVGVATTSWMVYRISSSYIRVGLWRMSVCTGTTCTENDVAEALKSASVIMVGTILWLLYIPGPYVCSYSMGLTVLGAMLASIGGLLLVPDLIIDNTYCHTE